MHLKIQLPGAIHTHTGNWRKIGMELFVLQWHIYLAIVVTRMVFRYDIVWALQNYACQWLTIRDQTMRCLIISHVCHAELNVEQLNCTPLYDANIESEHSISATNLLKKYVNIVLKSRKIFKKSKNRLDVK